MLGLVLSNVTCVCLNTRSPTSSARTIAGPRQCAELGQPLPLAAKAHGRSVRAGAASTQGVIITVYCGMSLPTMKRATLYRRAGSLLIHASSHATPGLWVLEPPCLRIAEDAPADELSAMVRAALEGSRSGIPMPQIGPRLFAPMLQLAGVKSWSAFAKNAQCAELEELDGIVRVVPCERVPKRSFSKVEDQAIRVPSSASEELARACRAALGL